MDSCIFCSIIKKEIYAEILFEDDEIISILDINPMNYGHALIIPKEHSDDFLSTSSHLIPNLFLSAQKVAKALKSSLNPDGINLVANNGVYAGQSVFHTHIHVIPRYRDDGFQFKLDLKTYNDSDFLRFADKIRKQLS